MASFNKVILVGNLTRDPELKHLSSGTALAELGLAVNRTWFDKNTQQKKEEVAFIDVTLWGRTAEIAEQYLSKGRSVLIEGRLKFDQWEKDGQKRSKLSVVGEQMTMLGGGKGGGVNQDTNPGAGEENQALEWDDGSKPKTSGEVPF